MYSDRNILDVLIDYLLTLPIEDQNMILEAPIAFFDTLLTSTWIDEWMCYYNQIDVIEFYNELSAPKKESFQTVLEQLCFDNGMFTYCDGSMFDLISQKRVMIGKARERGIPDPSGIIQYPTYTWFKKTFTGSENSNVPKKPKVDAATQRKRFEQVILDFIQFDIKEYPVREGNRLIDDIMDGISFRLKMSPFAWHLDMLHSVCRLNNLGDEVDRLITLTKDT